MNTLYLILEYPDARRDWNEWAEDDNRIDFRRCNPMEAARCTAAYAAGELKYFLERADSGLRVEVVSEVPVSAPSVQLITGQDDASGGGFDLIPGGTARQTVRGHGRNGLLNGVYELLRIQGWRWLEPGVRGEVRPKTPTLDFLDVQASVRPSFRWRMIDQYRDSDDSIPLLQWFSRQRVNVVFRKPATGRFADKLGMLSRRGGHLLQRLLDPDAAFGNGQTLFDAHPEWFGLPENGIRSRETVIAVQPCCSNTGLLEYLAKQLLDLLTGDMCDIDVLDVWGFDTLGKTCSCSECRKLGNGADQNLYLLSNLFAKLEGALGRNIMLNTIAYEPTATLEPPTRPAPRNLVESGAFVIFYPISRCYRHGLGDPECEQNRSYRNALVGWHQSVPELSLWMGEYYNISFFQDLPLVFTRLIPSEIRWYFDHGCNGGTYMHNFAPCWGVRALTQLQHTQFLWEANTDAEAFGEEYFRSKYGLHARAMRQVYADVEKGFADIASWRYFSFGASGFLKQWGGEIHPEKPFALPHFPEPGSAKTALRESSYALDRALAGARRALRAERAENWHNLPAEKHLSMLPTPAEIESFRYYDTLEYRIGEDCRGLIYGADTMRFLLRAVEYYEALRCGGDSVREWHAFERIAEKMSEYYVPVTYEFATPGMSFGDALSRTDLRILLTRCRAERVKNGLCL